jgi:hypothetical protein
MTSIKTFIVEPRTPELAICARWRASAFSVLKASLEQELRSLELFASDQRHGVALVAKADGEPVGTCLLAESEIEPNQPECFRTLVLMQARPRHSPGMLACQL